MMLNFILLFLILTQIFTSAMKPQSLKLPSPQSSPISSKKVTASSSSSSSSSSTHLQRHHSAPSSPYTIPLSFRRGSTSKDSPKKVQFQSEMDILHEFKPSSFPPPFSPSSSSIGSPSTHLQRRHSEPSSPSKIFSKSPIRNFLRSTFSSMNLSKLSPGHKSSQLTVLSPLKRDPFCDSKNRDKMKKIRFISDISSKELKVKVAIDEGNFAEGKFAQLYNGCFKINEEGKRQKWEHVAVKLVGRRTIQSDKNELDKISDDQIMDDPKKEVENLKKIKEKRNFNSEQIIKLYDGGKIHENSDYLYVVILELGGNNYLDAFVEKFINKVEIEDEKIKKPEIDEKEFMEFLAIGIEPFIQLRKILIHMDLKPQNMIFVKPKIHTDSNEGQIMDEILKVIDFGGAHFYQQNPQSNDEPGSSSKSSKSQQSEVDGIQLKKVTSTAHIMPPEMDMRNYFDMFFGAKNFKSFIPMATTKSDMWEFGMLIWNLLLVREYPEKSQKEIAIHLDKISKIYKFGNESETVEKIGEFIGKMDKPFGKDEEIFIYVQILTIRAKYPPIFVLITNLLDKNPEERLSAQGAFDYLKTKCKIVQRKEEYENEMNKFIGNKITIKMLKELKSDDLDKLINEIEENMEKMIKKELKKLEKISKICDRNYGPNELVSYLITPDSTDFSPILSDDDGKFPALIDFQEQF